MVTALVRDFSDLPGVHVSYCRDRNLAPLQRGKPAWVQATNGKTLWAAWKNHINHADVVVPIAPETGGLLLSLAENVRKCGRHLLASASSALALTASKSATASCLHAQKIPVIPSHRPGQAIPASPRGWIIKPDDGAGAQGVRYAANRHEMDTILSQNNPTDDTLIIQPYIPGPVASLCTLYHNRQVTLLAANSITMQQDQGIFSYAALQVGAMNNHRDCFDPLAKAVGQAIPGLCGYIGIDLIQDDDGRWRVMEINPRMTSTYPKLRQVLGKNPASFLLAPFFENR